MNQAKFIKLSSNFEPQAQYSLIVTYTIYDECLYVKNITHTYVLNI